MEPVLGDAAGVIFELAEDGEAEFFVEGTGLEVEGVKPDAGEVAGAGDGFGLLHEGAAEAGAAEGFGNDEHVDEEPVVAGEAPEAAEDDAFWVFDEEAERLVVMGWGGGCVVGEEGR